SHGAPLARCVCLQVPSSQMSSVHRLPSLQFVGTQGLQPWIDVWTQPLVGLHVSVVQLSSSSQLSVVPDWQTPLWQASAPLQGLPSPHELPSGAAGWTQTPATQRSMVHAWPSLHSLSVVQGVQPPMEACPQPWLASQVSVVQAL